MNTAEQFEAIVSEHYEPLYRFAMSLTRSESDAQDLTQQTFYIWATKGHQLRDIARVRTWLFTTLHRSFLVAYRKQSRFAHHDFEEISAQLPAHSPVVADRVDCSQVLAALAEVDAVYQAAVALFYVEDWSYKNIAIILEVPIGTVKSRIARGIAQLRKILLSDRSPVASRSKYEGPEADTSSPRTEGILSHPRHHDTWMTSAERDYPEWDLSSTHLPGTSRP